MNTPSTPPLVYESVREFLRRHTPFSRMSEDTLRFMIPRLHIIQTGNVASVTAGLDTMPDRVLQSGESFPVGALSAGGQPTRSYRAADDVFAYLLPVDDFQRLRQLSPEFAAYCTEAVTVLAQQSLAELQRHYSQVASDQHSLTRPLAQLIPSEPVTCLASTPLRAALT